MLNHKKFKKLDAFAWLVIILFILALVIATQVVSGYLNG